MTKYKLTGAERYCPGYNTKYKVTTKETVKRLKFIPAQFEIVEEATYVYSCHEMRGHEVSGKRAVPSERQYGDPFPGGRDHELKCYNKIVTGAIFAKIQTILYYLEFN